VIADHHVWNVRILQHNDINSQAITISAA